jgi:hypothetical protein
MCVSIFQTAQIWKEIMLELNGKPFKCYHILNRFLLSKPGFLEFIWIFSGRNHLKMSKYLPHSESKSYQINSIKSCSSRSFQQHQRHIPIPPKISAKKIIQYSRTFTLQVQTSWNQAHAPLLVERELSKETKNTIWSIPVRWIS